jgi:hypothetical protein
VLLEPLPDWPTEWPLWPTMLHPPYFEMTEATMMDGATVNYLEADVRCYHCGQSVGVLRRATKGSAAVRAFRRHADGAWIVVRALASLRCDRCAGPLFAEPFMERYLYRLDLDRDRPGRGRPRKRLNGQPEVDRPGA